MASSGDAWSHFNQNVAVAALLVVMTLAGVHGVSYSGTRTLTVTPPTVSSSETVANYSLLITIVLNRPVGQLTLRFSNTASALSARLPGVAVTPSFSQNSVYFFFFSQPVYVPTDQSTLRSAVSSIILNATTPHSGVTSVVSATVNFTTYMYNIVDQHNMPGGGSSNGQSWEDSDTLCRGSGYIIPSPTSVFEWDRIYQFLKAATLARWIGARTNNSANLHLFCWQDLPNFDTTGRDCPTNNRVTYATAVQVDDGGAMTCKIQDTNLFSVFCGNVSLNLASSWTANGVNALYYDPDIPGINVQLTSTNAYAICSRWQSGTSLATIQYSSLGVLVNARTRSRTLTVSRHSPSQEQSGSRTAGSRSATHSWSSRRSSSSSPSLSNSRNASKSDTGPKSMSKSQSRTATQEQTMTRTITPVIPPTKTKSRSTSGSRGSSSPSSTRWTPSFSGNVTKSRTSEPTSTRSWGTPSISSSAPQSLTRTNSGNESRTPTAPKTRTRSGTKRTKSRSAPSSMTESPTRTNSTRVTGTLGTESQPTTATWTASLSSSVTEDITLTERIADCRYYLTNATIPYAEVTTATTTSSFPFARTVMVTTGEVPFALASLGVWSGSAVTRPPLTSRCQVFSAASGTPALIRDWIAQNVSLIFFATDDSSAPTLAPTLPPGSRSSWAQPSATQAYLYVPPMTAYDRVLFFGPDPTNDIELVTPRAAVALQLQLTNLCSSRGYTPMSDPLSITLAAPPVGVPSGVQTAQDLKKVVGPTVAAVGLVVSGASTGAQIARTSFVLGLYACVPTPDQLDWVQNPISVPLGSNLASTYAGVCVFNPMFLTIVGAVQIAAGYVISVVDDISMQQAFTIVKFPSIHAFLILVLLDATTQSVVVSMAFGEAYQIAIGVMAFFIITVVLVIISIQLYRTFDGVYVPNELMEARSRFHRFVFGDRWWIDSTAASNAVRYAALQHRYAELKDNMLLRHLFAKRLAEWKELIRDIDGAFGQIGLQRNVKPEVVEVFDPTATPPPPPPVDKAEEDMQLDTMDDNEAIAKEAQERDIILSMKLPPARFTPGYCQRNKMFFNEYNDRIPYFFIVDMWVTALSGILDGLKLGGGKCEWVGFSYVVLFSSYMVAIIGLRPHVCLYVTFFAVLQTLLQLLAAFCFCLGWWTRQPVFFNISAILANTGLYVLLAGVIVDSFKFVRKTFLRFMWRKQQQLAQALEDAFAKTNKPDAGDNEEPLLETTKDDKDADADLAFEMAEMEEMETITDFWSGAPSLGDNVEEPVTTRLVETLVYTEARAPEAPPPPRPVEGLHLLVEATIRNATAQRRQDDHDLIERVLAARDTAAAKRAIDVSLL